MLAAKAGHLACAILVGFVVTIPTAGQAQAQAQDKADLLPASPAPSAQASDQSALLDQAVSSLKEMVTPPAGPPAPLTPERLAAAQRYVAALHVQQGLEVAVKIQVDQVRDQVADKFKALPLAQRSQIEDAFVRAAEDVGRRSEQRQIGRIVDYYAGYLTPEEMDEAIAFYATPLGATLVPPTQPPTPEQRQELGLYAMKHPAILKTVSAQFGYIQMQAQDAKQTRELAVADMQSTFCRNMQPTHIRMTTCDSNRSGASSASASQTVAPIPRKPPIITNPIWIEKPNGAAFGSYYPMRAMIKHQEGQVTLNCTVAEDGSLTDCSALESNPGYGFGDASLRIAKLFRMAPQTRDGMSVAGAHFSTVINWKLADETPPLPPSTAPSP